MADADVSAGGPRTPSHSHLGRSLVWLQGYPWILPVAGFIFGWASYVLVDRGNAHVARVIAALALVGWPWLMAESVLGKWLEQRSQGYLGIGVVRYLTQSIQLEMLFFALPFLIGATQYDAGHFAFTGLAMLAALVCSVDPWYTRLIGERPFAGILFHAYCNFIGALIVLPVAAQLSLELSLPLALALTGLMLLLSLPRALMRASPKRRLLRLCVLALLPMLVWIVHHHIPAAALRVSESRMTPVIFEPLRPGPEKYRFSVSDLHREGAIAFCAIRAPAGLAQSVIFVWRQEDEEVDRIAATITGGREQGYRLYSRKRAFPENPRGRWTVDLLAPDGRLINRWRFRVD